MTNYPQNHWLTHESNCECNPCKAHKQQREDREKNPPIDWNNPAELCTHCKKKNQFHADDNRLCSDCDWELNFEAAHDAYIYRND